MKLPHIKDVRALLITLKTSIDDDSRAEDDESGLPGIDVTIGANEDGEWGYQTGSNQYMGGAYFYQVWGTEALYRRSNCTELAKDLVDQIADQIADQM